LYSQYSANLESDDMLVFGSNARRTIEDGLFQRLRHAHAASVSWSAVIRAGRNAAALNR
jgi:hypothetical protein